LTLQLCPPLFPYTTLFRSVSALCAERLRSDDVGRDRHDLGGKRRSGVTHIDVAAQHEIPGMHLALSGPYPHLCACVSEAHRPRTDRKSTRLNSSHQIISYA